MTGTEQFIIQLGLIPKIKVANTYLKKVKKTKSIGLIIDDNLKWDDHIQYICREYKMWVLGQAMHLRQRIEQILQFQCTIKLPSIEDKFFCA